MGNAEKTKKTVSDAQRILTPEFRVSYPHLFKPSQVNGKGDPKYSITMLFPKDADLTELKKAIKAAKVAEWGPNKENWPEEIASPVVDGDKPKYADKEGYEGHWAIKAISSQDQKPGLVDEDVKPILDQAKFYPGCYARAYIFARVYEYGGEYGVHFILDHVQKVRDGKSFSSRKPADQIFTPISAGDDGGFEDEADDQDFR